MPRILLVTAVTIACLCLFVEASGPPPVAQFKNLFEHGLQMRAKDGMSRSGRVKRDEARDVKLPAPLEKVRDAFMELLNTEPEEELDEAVEELDEAVEARGKKPKKPKSRPPFWRDRRLARSFRSRFVRFVRRLNRFLNGGSSPSLMEIAEFMNSLDEEPTTTPADTTTPV